MGGLPPSPMPCRAKLTNCTVLCLNLPNSSPFSPQLKTSLPVHVPAVGNVTSGRDFFVQIPCHRYLRVFVWFVKRFSCCVRPQCEVTALAPLFHPSHAQFLAAHVTVRAAAGWLQCCSCWCLARLDASVCLCPSGEW